MYFNCFCKEAETENSEMARWRVLVFDTMTTALEALMFFEECPIMDQHKRRAQYGRERQMGRMNFQEIIPYRSGQDSCEYPNKSISFSGYLCTRLHFFLVRGPLRGKGTPKTWNISFFWPQKLLSACSWGYNSRFTWKCTMTNMETRLAVTLRPLRVFLFRLMPSATTDARFKCCPL